MATHRPTTPLRRISRGSLSALSRSSGPTSTPLDFLHSAMADLADETTVLQGNLESVDAIEKALGAFNESFAKFLWGMRMNAYCVDWLEAPREDNFERAEKRAAAASAPNPQPSSTGPSFFSPPPDETNSDMTYRTVGPSISGVAGGGAAGGGQVNPADMTYMTADEDVTMMAPSEPDPPAPKPKGVLKRAASGPPRGRGRAVKRGGAVVSAATKRKREMAIDGIVETLPLEYRGNDPTLRSQMERVIATLMGAPDGLRITEIVKPDLPQARVNKCLIALVGAKHVHKLSRNGAVYQLDASKLPAS